MGVYLTNTGNAEIIRAATLYYTILYYATLHYATLRYTTLHYTTTPYYTKQNYTTILYCTILYYTILLVTQTKLDQTMGSSGFVSGVSEGRSPPEKSVGVWGGGSPPSGDSGERETPRINRPPR